ncbi:hypothetical protein QBC35DRAFT_484348 [Podospora australis]|uniref:UBX domain-containing protein 2 n=1 Tax=Podospora australis TaxID=1536484 RepID=A0AAN7AL02_9PEZI|nr:hypothetical protein QBC35DRAFT_484348 [Podospora australis]
MAFFQGTLQEGIASALAQLKSVVCFVTDGQDESQLWENEFLKEGDVMSTLTSTAVLLRLEAGSTEEGFLAQLYPIPKKPTVVIIKDGALKEYIAAGVSKDVFRERLLKALGLPATQNASVPSQTRTETAESTAAVAQAAPAPSASSTSSPSQKTPEDSNADSSDSAASPAPAPAPTLASVPTPQQSFNSSSQAQAVAAAQRATELTNQRKEEEARKRREEKGKAREEPPASPPPAATDAPHKHAEALKKKQQEAREERQRILRAIEADKAERKARLAAAQAERKAAAAAAEAQSAEAPSTPIPSAAKTKRFSEHAAIQVRLFDGSTIRNRFSSTSTLKEVRQWVDENREDGKDAYTFKILLTPLPSKTIDTTEEDKTLRDLELTPSATLILVHIPKAASAYSSRRLRSAVSSAGSASSATQEVEGNIFQRFIGFILAIINGFFNGISTFFSALFSTSAPPGGGYESDGSQNPDVQASERPVQQNDRRIGGLDSIRRRNEQQFYNGNSTNFEPRPDDEE